ncbi:plasmid SOS inhibition protein A [Serratia symbiotica]|uniref:plasmid SOS inhibition protein A n=1 Tax=Serratia symbiotica TaxID=138074 RepID=UPI000682ED29|nr:plasmid SOS inhibition protein A [Serratia symbiotica]
MPEYSPRDRHGPAAADYLRALDVLIRTRGERCPLPLSSHTGQSLFPETLTRTAERQTRRTELRVNRRFSREAREREQKRRRYQYRLAQAEIDLAFHTPATVGSWYSHWQHQDLYEEDLQMRVYAWLRRFPSGQRADHMEWEGEKLWRVMLDISDMAGELAPHQQLADRMALPDRLFMYRLKIVLADYRQCCKIEIYAIT